MTKDNVPKKDGSLPDICPGRTTEHTGSIFGEGSQLRRVMEKEAG